MFKIESSRTQEIRATSERKAKRALDDENRARADKAKRTASLRAQRLAKQAADKAADGAK